MSCIPVIRSNNTRNGRAGEAFSKGCGATVKVLNKVMEEHFGCRPDGMLIRHLCENDSSFPNGFTCCNPEHITWGTKSENALDDVARGKHGSQTHPETYGDTLRKLNKERNAISYTCDRCGKIGKGPRMKKHVTSGIWCHGNPTSSG